MPVWFSVEIDKKFDMNYFQIRLNDEEDIVRAILDIKERVEKDKKTAYIILEPIPEFE